MVLVEQFDFEQFDFIFDSKLFAVLVERVQKTLSYSTNILRLILNVNTTKNYKHKVEQYMNFFMVLIYVLFYKMFDGQNVISIQ